MEMSCMNDPHLRYQAMDGMSGFGWYCAGGKTQAFNDSLCCTRFFCWFCWHESRTQEIRAGFPIGQYVKCDTCDNNPDGTKFHYEQTGTRAQLPRDIIDDLNVPALDLCRDCCCNWGFYDGTEGNVSIPESCHVFPADPLKHIETLPSYYQQYYKYAEEGALNPEFSRWRLCHTVPEQAFNIARQHLTKMEELDPLPDDQCRDRC